MALLKAADGDVAGCVSIDFDASAFAASNIKSTMRFRSVGDPDDAQSCTANGYLTIGVRCSVQDLPRPSIDQARFRIAAFIHIDRGNIAARQHISNAMRLACSDRFDCVAAAAPARRIIIGSVYAGIVDTAWRFRITIATAALPAPSHPIWFEAQGR